MRPTNSIMGFLIFFRVDSPVLTVPKTCRNPFLPPKVGIVVLHSILRSMIYEHVYIPDNPIVPNTLPPLS